VLWVEISIYSLENFFAGKFLCYFTSGRIFQGIYFITLSSCKWQKIPQINKLQGKKVGHAWKLNLESTEDMSTVWLIELWSSGQGLFKNYIAHFKWLLLKNTSLSLSFCQ
jgi:hypothetical protein